MSHKANCPTLSLTAGSGVWGIFFVSLFANMSLEHGSSLTHNTINVAGGWSFSTGGIRKKYASMRLISLLQNLVSNLFQLCWMRGSNYILFEHPRFPALWTLKNNPPEAWSKIEMQILFVWLLEFANLNHLLLHG